MKTYEEADDGFITYVLLKKNGECYSVDDDTWFKEELDKGEHIKYDKEDDYYTVTSKAGFKWAKPGDILVKFNGECFVIGKIELCLYLTMAYGALFMKNPELCFKELKEELSDKLSEEQ